MDIILTEDFNKGNGLKIKKGTRVTFTNDKAKELIENKKARKPTVVDILKKKIKDRKENAAVKTESEKAVTD